MQVYKFLDTHFGLKSLRKRRIKISILSDLNDPFELSAVGAFKPSLSKCGAPDSE